MVAWPVMMHWHCSRCEALIKVLLADDPVPVPLLCQRCRDHTEVLELLRGLEKRIAELERDAGWRSRLG